MPFIVHTTLDPEQVDLRVRVRPEHLAYLDRHMRLLLAAGMTLSQDGATPTGSFYMLDAEELSIVNAFMADEPYFRAGILTDIRVSRWKKAIFNFARVQAP
jgi:uncharacterized protein YciI